MSIFPTKILLATDGSEEAALAARMAAGIADKTDSALHVGYVRPKVKPHYPGYYVGPGIVARVADKKSKRSSIYKLRGCWTLRWRKSELPEAGWSRLISGSEGLM